MRTLRRPPGRGRFTTPAAYDGRPTLEEPRSRWTRPGFIISALVLLAVVVLGARLVFFNDSPQAVPAKPTIPAIPAARARTPCTGFPAKPPPPPTAPGETQWRPVGAVKAPLVDGLGPFAAVEVSNPLTGEKGQLPVCYAPGPGGALLAAANWLAAGTASPLVDAEVRQLTAASPGRQAMVDKLEKNPELLNASGSASYQFTGYHFESQTPDQVTVWLAIVTGQGVRGYLSMTVVHDPTVNDWVVVPPPSGDMRDVQHQMDSDAGFTPWESPS